MPMPAVLTCNGTSTSAIWTPDWMQVPFNVGIGTIVTGGAGYNIEFTMDNMDAATTTAGQVTWYQTQLTALSSSTTATFTTACRGMRLNLITAASVGSSVTVNFVQATFPR